MVYKFFLFETDSPHSSHLIKFVLPDWFEIRAEQQVVAGGYLDRNGLRATYKKRSESPCKCYSPCTGHDVETGLGDGIQRRRVRQSRDVRGSHGLNGT